MAGDILTRGTVVAALSVLAALGGCRDQSASAAASPANAAETTAAAPKRNDADLAAREAAVLRWLESDLDTRKAAGPYRRSIENRVARLRGCTTDPCRRAVSAERTAAVAFAEGEAARIPNLPFASGRFARAEVGYTGPVRVIPLADGTAILAALLSFKGRPSCTLSGTISRNSRGGWSFAALEEGLPAMTLTAEGPAAFALSYVDPGHKPWETDYCTVGTSIDGRYVRAR